MNTYDGKCKELIILTEHFAPSMGATSQLVTDLADDLHHMGVSLRVLTSTTGADTRSYPVHRFFVSSSSAVDILQKTTNGVVFFLGSALWLLFNIKKDQSLFIVSNPPFIGLIGVLLSIVKGTRYVFLLQDLFPRSASLTGILPSQGPLIFFWRSLLQVVLNKSEATVVLSSAMARRCHWEFGPHINLALIPNWAVLSPQERPKGQTSLASMWGLANIFTVQYSGNFGRLHDILTILEAARLLQGEAVCFVFVGGGAKSSLIHRYCDSYGLKNVLIKPYQPRSLLPESLAACDLSIVSLIPGAEDTVAPSKFYGIIASSRPILLISADKSDLADEVRQANCGVVVPQGDVCLLAETISTLKDNPELVASMGQNAGILYSEKYGRSRSVAQYHKLFCRCNMF